MSSRIDRAQLMVSTIFCSWAKAAPKVFGEKDEVLRKVVRSVAASSRQMPSPVVTSPRALPQITYKLRRFDDWAAKVDRFDTVWNSQVPSSARN